MKLLKGDCIEKLKDISDKSIDLVLTDPPYNIGRDNWDKIDNYIDWCIKWLKECERVLTDTGSLYIWHNDMNQMPELMEEIRKKTDFKFRQLNIWVKPNFRCMAWKVCGEKNKLRNWFNICEYCLYYVKNGSGNINSNSKHYSRLVEWYKAEKKRLDLTDNEIARKYTETTGRKPYMLRHYFRGSQFEIPSRKVWESAYIPLGFEWTYEELRQSYKELRQSNEKLRPVHNLDTEHCNVWMSKQITGSESNGKNHICEKPIDILERIIRTSTLEGQTVLDCFMGSASTGIACMHTNRKFIGIENDEKIYEKAVERIKHEKDCMFVEIDGAYYTMEQMMAYTE